MEQAKLAEKQALMGAGMQNATGALDTMASAAYSSGQTKGAPGGGPTGG